MPMMLLNDLEPFAGKGMKDLRAIVNLYEEVVQLVALADSGIKSVANLKGKRVSVGARRIGRRTQRSPNPAGGGP